jgi:probable F420-dependent oxidoreductase
MEIGLAVFATDTTVRPDELATEVEAQGFDALFFTEHTHMPVRHSLPSSGGPLPEEYRRTHDPFVALAVAATATSRLRLGTGVCLVAQHDPIVLAKQVASVDVLSGGRLLLGVGYGWNIPEAEHHGVTFGERREVLREHVLAMKALWTQDEASFHGRYVDFAPSWSWPKPAQRPHPPVVLGADAGDRTFDHIVEFADGWMPSRGPDLEAQLPRLRQRTEDAGRDPATIAVTVFSAPRDPARLEQFMQLGVERVVFWLPSAGRDDVLRALEAHLSFLEPLGHLRNPP